MADMQNAPRVFRLPFVQIPNAEHGPQLGDVLLVADVPAARAVLTELTPRALAALATYGNPAVRGRRNYWRWDFPPPLAFSGQGGFPAFEHFDVSYPGPQQQFPAGVGAPLFSPVNLNPQNKNPDLGNVSPGLRTPRVILPSSQDTRIAATGPATTDAVFGATFQFWAGAAAPPYDRSDPIGLLNTTNADSPDPIPNEFIGGLFIGGGFAGLTPGQFGFQGDVVYFDPTAGPTGGWVSTPNANTSLDFVGILQIPSAAALPNDIDIVAVSLLSRRY